MVKVAAFPHQKDISQFDFSFQPNLNEAQIRHFLSLKFIEKNENIVLIGSSRVGKTHLSIAIGMEAARNRYSTYFIKCHDLIMN